MSLFEKGEERNTIKVLQFCLFNLNLDRMVLSYVRLNLEGHEIVHLIIKQERG